ncbi:MAG: DUF1653 domain-containing protein [Litoreibacter sp.]
MIKKLLRAVGFAPRPILQRSSANNIGETIADGQNWVPTHRHKKGGLYRVLGRGVYEADRSDVVIYDDVDGTVWVRSTDEFEDGRFSKLT